MSKRGKRSSVILPLVLVIGVLCAGGWIWHSIPGYKIQPGFLPVQKAYENKRSGIMVEVPGYVVRVLTTEPGGARYQQFVIRLENGQTVQVMHETSLSNQIPIEVNDNVLVRGEYNWSEGGGAIRGTERDFSTDRRHGWIEHKGKRYN